MVQTIAYRGILTSLLVVLQTLLQVNNCNKKRIIISIVHFSIFHNYFSKMAVGWTLVFQRLVTVSLFQFVRLLFVVIQRVHWKLNGTARRLREVNDPKNYERSAQVLDILLEHHFCDTQPHSLGNMICTHNRFENPQFIIDNEHVTLFGIDDKQAIFGVAREKGINKYSNVEE